MCNGYVDDRVLFGIKIPGMEARLTHAEPVTCEAIFCSERERFGQNRDQILLAEKLEAELCPDTTKKTSDGR